MPGPDSDQRETAVTVHNRDGRGPVMVVCEHASRVIPARYGDLGLRPELLDSHIAWDSGALPVAQGLSSALDAPLVASDLSRLLFDCNRPPEAPDAIPDHSEIHDIPGNQNLNAAERANRVTTIHDPFRDGLQGVMNRFASPPVMITVHSFTPVYRGQTRDVEIGLICDSDERLARAMMSNAADHTARIVRLNDPYGPQDGVTHTLRTHALPIGAINVMLEIRNDLIRDAAAQTAMVAMLTRWIVAACADLGVAPPLKVST
ncbi:N-formylglutamate amidohydrolase [Sedimentitalea todarodis]|uniref:N-formylglutamate amidohydrolase n=1 Tax=Sedimentitalea todarodis TaxID=1631240 RepID=A0ABU3V9X1_9RHOB|nr:N-formylglutamate amidohydrolase [Sedimentitalea todarodis]MDU9002971.1 N-formylglutamate amidohydrolase [Sedimentitalea todarodis]